MINWRIWAVRSFLETHTIWRCALELMCWIQWEGFTNSWIGLEVFWQIQAAFKWYVTCSGYFGYIPSVNAQDGWVQTDVTTLIVVAYVLGHLVYSQNEIQIVWQWELLECCVQHSYGSANEFTSTGFYELKHVSLSIECDLHQCSILPYLKFEELFH